MTFTITLTAESYVKGSINITDALNLNDALMKALQYAKEGNMSWTYQGINDSTLEAHES